LITQNLSRFYHNLKSSQIKMKSHYKVIVVGAGMAGCAVGNTLLENGITDFLILEAKQVPGGRVKTIEKGMPTFSEP